MSHARETTLTFFVMYLSPLVLEVYLLVNLFEKPVHNAIRHFSCFNQNVLKFSYFSRIDVLWYSSEAPLRVS